MAEKLNQENLIFKSYSVDSIALTQHIYNEKPIEVLHSNTLKDLYPNFKFK